MSPSSGGGVVAPIVCPPGLGSDLVQPFPYTLLSVDRFARIMGINPAHFWGASAPNVDPQVMPVVLSCSAVWFKYSWQDTDRVGRLDIAHEILTAERDIAAAVGFWPAPTWVQEDRVPYPRPYMPEMFSYGRDVRNRPKSVNAAWGKVIKTGRRAVSLIATATSAGGTLSYTDEDSDGLYETATIIVATSLTDTCDIKVYFAGRDGDPDWEIREARSKKITGGFLTIIFDAWLLIDPEFYEALPTTDTPDLIDVGVTTNFVTSVDVYREYADTVQAASEFYWEPDFAGCEDTVEGCTEIEQDGCLRIRDSKEGILVPIPSTYSEGSWLNADWVAYREPDFVKMWYLCGDVDYRNPACMRLSHFWAQTIAWLAAARLERQFCQCGNLESLHVWLRTDRAQSETGVSFFVTPGQVENPFGTRNGEVAAWKRVSKLIEKRSHYAVV